jgi:hypothetical protein
VIERGTKSIDVMLYFMLFNIAPTVIELAAVAGDLLAQVRRGNWSRQPLVGGGLCPRRARSPNGATSAARGDEPNSIRQALARAVDSLLNYETVKYFNAEEREADYYAQVARAYADAAIKSENSLGLLNIGAGADHQPDDGGRDGLSPCGAGRRGKFHHWAMWCWSTPISCSCSARSTCSAWSIARSGRG